MIGTLLLSFIADRALKSVVMWLVEERTVIPLISPYLSLAHVVNYGGPFGIAVHNGFYPYVVLFEIVLLTYLIEKGGLLYESIRAWGVLIGSSVSNLVDRFAFGGVVDFLALGSLHLNLADVLILIAIIRITSNYINSYVYR